MLVELLAHGRRAARVGIDRRHPGGRRWYALSPRALPSARA
jgi:hypothetical protein